MGADFILSWMPDITPVSPERLEALKAVAATLKPEDFYDPPDDLADARAAVLDALEWLGWADHDRGVCHFTYPGLPHCLLMTGGMSWGDAPTEAMEFMDTLCGCAPIWSRIEAWALEAAAATSGGAGAGKSGSDQGA
jgi:hypothetical protein